MKTVARDLGLSKNTVRKYVRSLQAPDYQSPKRGVPARRVLLSHRRFDASIAEDNSSSHRRTTARLRRSGLQISERSLREYVANRRREILGKEAFVRALYVPGDQMQFDFTPVDLIVAGCLPKCTCSSLG